MFSVYTAVRSTVAVLHVGRQGILYPVGHDGGGYIIAIDQFPRFVYMQYRSTNPEGKARGMSVSILHTKRGIGQ